VVANKLHMATRRTTPAASFAMPPTIGEVPDGVAPPGAGMQGFIEYVAPDGAPQRRPLALLTSIGRHTDNVIQVLDPEVSKQHLVIRRVITTTGPAFQLEDLGSANGTLVNGGRVSRHPLAHDDVIVVGNTVIRFRVEQIVAPPRTPPGMQAVRPLTSFAEARREQSKANTGPSVLRAPETPKERTTVTLIPSDLLPSSNEAVFEKQLTKFQAEKSVNEERALRRDYERLRTAFELMNAIGLEDDLETLGQNILAKIRALMPTDTAVIMLRDPNFGADLVTLSSFADGGAEVRIPRAIVDRVLTTKAGMLTSDAQIDQHLRRSETVVGQRIRSAMCVPMIVQGEVLGAIHVSSMSLAGAYEEKDLGLLAAIAQPAALAVANARLRLKIEEETAMRHELSRFLSPALVEKAVRNELAFGKTGDKVQATVVFADIRGFTSISEGVAPEAVVSMLNEYFDAMVEVVFAYGGTLDKFLGDGLMAVWGTPVQSPDDAARAVRAAAGMREALDRTVNTARIARGEAPLKTGYGVATGFVIAGAMGARRRQDFTVIGDTVNLASRLCSAAAPGQVLIDEHSERLCTRPGGPPLRRRALEPLKVKGFARPVPVFEVLSNNTDAAALSFGDKEGVS
jgi:adenylate cyclase